MTRVALLPVVTALPGDRNSKLLTQFVLFFFPKLQLHPFQPSLFFCLCISLSFIFCNFPSSNYSVHLLVFLTLSPRFVPPVGRNVYLCIICVYVLERCEISLLSVHICAYNLSCRLSVHSEKLSVD